jgi:hypothetical protein
MGVSASLITAINGLIVVFVVSSQVFIKRRVRRRLKETVHTTNTPASITAEAQI